MTRWLAPEITQVLAPYREHARTDPAVAALVDAVEAAVDGHTPHRRYQVATSAYDQRPETERHLCQHCQTDLVEDESGHDYSEDGEWLCLDRPLPTVCALCSPLHEEAGHDDVTWPCPTIRRVLDTLI